MGGELREASGRAGGRAGGRAMNRLSVGGAGLPGMGGIGAHPLHGGAGRKEMVGAHGVAHGVAHGGLPHRHSISHTSVVRPVARESEEFAELDYLFRLSTGDLDVKVNEAWAVDNPHLIIKFEQASKGLLVLDSWVDTSTLGSEKRGRGADGEGGEAGAAETVEGLNGVCTSGFSLDEQRGMEFAVGAINLGENAGQEGATTSGADADAGGEMTLELLLCRIAVGSAYYTVRGDTIQRPAAEVATASGIPDGYHSLYLAEPQHREAVADWEPPSAPGGSKDAGAMAGGTAYNHRYLIFEKNRVLPSHIIRITVRRDQIGANLIKAGAAVTGGVAGSEIPLCDACEEDPPAPAVVYAPSTESCFCARCDARVHSTRYMQRVKRVPVAERARYLEEGGDGPSSSARDATERNGQCAHHAGHTPEYFCPQCYVPVCVQCKMVGHHSRGNASNHVLVPLADAYAEAVEASTRQDSQLARRHADLRARLGDLRHLRGDVLDNYEAVCNRLTQAFARALHRLETVKDAKLLIVAGEESELHRQVCEIEWSEARLAEFRQRLSRTRFLSAWQSHLTFRTLHLHQHIDSKPPRPVKIDIDMLGAIDIAPTLMTIMGEDALVGFGELCSDDARRAQLALDKAGFAHEVEMVSQAAAGASARGSRLAISAAGREEGTALVEPQRIPYKLASKSDVPPPAPTSARLLETASSAPPAHPGTPSRARAGLLGMGPARHKLPRTPLSATRMSIVGRSGSAPLSGLGRQGLGERMALGESTDAIAERGEDCKENAATPGGRTPRTPGKSATPAVESPSGPPPPLLQLDESPNELRARMEN